MNTIEKYYTEKGFDVLPVKFKRQGVTIKRKGYDIVEPKTGRIYATFEPKTSEYFKTYWFVNGQYIGKATRKILSGVKLKTEGFRYRSEYLAR